MNRESVFGFWFLVFKSGSKFLVSGFQVWFEVPGFRFPKRHPTQN